MQETSLASHYDWGRRPWPLRILWPIGWGSTALTRASHRWQNLWCTRSPLDIRWDRWASHSLHCCVVFKVRFRDPLGPYLLWSIIKNNISLLHDFNVKTLASHYKAPRDVTYCQFCSICSDKSVSLSSWTYNSFRQKAKHVIFNTVKPSEGKGNYILLSAHACPLPFALCLLVQI